MKNETVYLKEETPEPNSTRCKTVVYTIAFLLRFGSFLIALAIFICADLFYAIASGLIAYIIIGIVKSKMRSASIPPSQHEFSYNDTEIAKWYAKKILC